VNKTNLPQFLRRTLGTAIANFSHRNSVCPSVYPFVRPSHGWISQQVIWAKLTWRAIVALLPPGQLWQHAIK